MLRLMLNDENKINVAHKNHTIRYGTDGSILNLFESVLAALAGCAGAYSRRACQMLNISTTGIEIGCKCAMASPYFFPVS